MGIDSGVDVLHNPYRGSTTVLHGRGVPDRGVSGTLFLHATATGNPVHASYELILVRLNRVSLRVIVGANAVGSLGAGIA